MPFLNHIDFAKVQAAMQSGRDFFGGADAAQLDEAIELMKTASESVASGDLRDIAESIYASDDIEIDDEGVGSSESDDGWWVQAWVWVPRADVTTEDEEDDDGNEA